MDVVEREKERASVLAIINWMPLYRDAASCYLPQDDFTRFEPFCVFHRLMLLYESLLDLYRAAQQGVP